MLAMLIHTNKESGWISKSQPFKIINKAFSVRFILYYAFMLSYWAIMIFGPLILV